MGPAEPADPQPAPGGRCPICTYCEPASAPTSHDLPLLALSIKPPECTIVRFQDRRDCSGWLHHAHPVVPLDKKKFGLRPYEADAEAAEVMVEV